jgi:hypothetical protein
MKIQCPHCAKKDTKKTICTCIYIKDNHKHYICNYCGNCWIEYLKKNENN